MVRFVDPRAQPGAAIEPYELCWDIAAGFPPSIGVLANGFPDSVPFADEVAAALGRRLPGTELRTWNKGNASAPASVALLDEVAGATAVCVALYGH
jgi:hypothetical protein